MGSQYLLLYSLVFPKQFIIFDLLSLLLLSIEVIYPCKTREHPKGWFEMLSSIYKLKQDLDIKNLKPKELPNSFQLKMYSTKRHV